MTPRRVVAIVNPRGGSHNGRAIWDRAGRALAAAGVRSVDHVTQRPGHAAELAASLDLAADDGLVVVGGDGTLHEVVNGLMRRSHPPPPIGVIAGGTGNAVRQHLGPCSPEQAVQRMLDGPAVPIDLARVETEGRGVYCLNLVGWGGVADINRTAERLRWLGATRYAIAAAARILRPKFRHARLTLDGVQEDGLFLFVIACCTRYVGSGMLMAPRADLTDGKIDVVAVRPMSRRQMIRLFTSVFQGRHLELPGVEYHQVKSFELADAIGPLNLDGELSGSPPIAVKVIPQGLRMWP